MKESAPAVKESAPAARAKDPSGLAHLDTVRFKSSDEYTRVVLELDDRVKYRYQVLQPNAEVGRPHRLYIDLEGSRLGHDVKSQTTVSDGILRSIRTGQYDKSTTRVVLDFLSMQDYKIFPLDNPYRIVVGRLFARRETRPRRSPWRPSARWSSPSTASTSPPKGSKQHAGDLLEQLGLTVRTIMLDPGHGGKDPGAVANGLREKDVNLRFVKILGKKLKEKGFHVIYTRTTDKFIALEQRTAMANVQKADLFLSVHCNANRSRSIHGLETYSLNLAKSKDAVRIAARENSRGPALHLGPPVHPHGPDGQLQDQGEPRPGRGRAGPHPAPRARQVAAGRQGHPRGPVLRAHGRKDALGAGGAGVHHQPDRGQAPQDGRLP